MAAAQFHLGLMHLDGIGVKPNADLGMDYLHLAADQEYRYILFIGSLKAGFVTERSKLGSYRAFRFQYPILTTSTSPPTKSTGIYCLLELEEHSFVHRAFITRKEPDIAPKTDLLRISPRSEKPTPDWAATTTRVCTARRRSEEPDIDHKRALEHPQKRPTHSLAALRDACYWLGCYYYTGMHSEEKVDPDFAQAYRVWAKAAEMGCAESRHNQACMLLTGQVGDAAKEPCEAAKEPCEREKAL